MINSTLENIKEQKVVIWGCGLLGTTNLVYMASAGYECLGIEINSKRVEEIRNLDYKLGSDVEVLGNYRNEYVQKRIHVTSDWVKAQNREFNIHVICIPTEKNGMPYIDPFIDVINKIGLINTNSPLIIIVESTITPIWFDIAKSILEKFGMLLNDHYYFGAAPRRDLFGDKNFSLSNTCRVIGGSCSIAQQIMQDFYGRYCNKIEVAIDYKHAMFSKIIENMFRFCNIFLCNQVMISLKNYDVTHILKLSGTKWNMEEYHPSLGIGGYCIPLSLKYYMEEMRKENTVDYGFFSMIDRINHDYINYIMKHYEWLFEDCVSIAVLGISYISNIKVTNGSIAFEIINILLNKGKKVGIHDPYIESDELQSINKQCNVISFPEGLLEYDTILILTGHDFYKDFSLYKNFVNDNCKVIDNLGVLKNNDLDGINYFEIGCNNSNR